MVLNNTSFYGHYHLKMKLLIWSLAILATICFVAPVKAARPGDIKRLLKTNDCQGCDLSGVNLAGADLSYNKLQNADLRGANLDGVNLRQTDLRHANLDGASLRNANLISTDFRDATFTKAIGLDSLSKGNTPESGVQVAQLGKVRAELYYQRDGENDFLYKNLRLRLLRNNQLLLEQKLSSGASDAADAPMQLVVQDLDGDREPEVLLDSFTGGAHCCTYSTIYYYNANRGKYYYIRQNWGDIGYDLKDLDGNGLPKFVSADDNFAYAFSSFAASGFPLQVWQYRQGQLLNVTRHYPKKIYNDAADYWQSYEEAKKNDSEVKGMLAAYLADKYLLDQSQDGWQQVHQAYQDSDRQQFFHDLRQFLQKAGYTSKN